MVSWKLGINVPRRTCNSDVTAIYSTAVLLKVDSVYKQGKN